jgi:hypothetical protein
MSGAQFDQFSKAAWETVLGRPFSVEAGTSAPVTLKLKSVSTGPAVIQGGQRSESFSLLFLGPADCLLPQRIYRFAQEQTGTLELFIVPIGRGPEGVEYEAVFNRLVNTTPSQ